MFKDWEQSPPRSSVPPPAPSRVHTLIAALQRLTEPPGTLCVASPLPVCTEQAMERSHCRTEGFLQSLCQIHVWYLQPPKKA